MAESDEIDQVVTNEEGVEAPEDRKPPPPPGPPAQPAPAAPAAPGPTPLRVFWVAAFVSAFVTMAVALREFGLLLSRVEGSNQAYGPGVFTSAKLRFWDTTDMLAAAAIWQRNHNPAGPLVHWHLYVDLFFGPALAVALYLSFVVSLAQEGRVGNW